MTLLQPSNLSSSLSKLDGTYIGTVVDNNDPEGLQRIKVMIPELFKGIPTINLPWAVKSPTSLDSNKYGLHKIPDIDELVIVIFDNNDVYTPIYYTGLLSVKLKNFVETYLSSIGLEDKYGNYLRLSEGKLEIKGSFTPEAQEGQPPPEDSATLEIEYAISSIKGTKSLDINYPKSTLHGDTEDSSLDIKYPTVNIEGSTENASMSIKYPTISIEGNVSIQGNLAVTGTISATGNITSDADIIAGSVSLLNHTHNYNPGPGGPTPTQPPNA